MKSTLRTSKTLNILLSIAMISVLATIGCTAGGSNPVTGEFDPMSGDADTTTPRESQMYYWSADEATYEPNNTAGTGASVTSGNLFLGHADAVTDQNDYFQVTYGEAFSLSIRLEWKSGAWMNIYLYNSAETLVGYLNAKTASPKVLNFYGLAPGTYYVRVKAFEGASDYTLGFLIGTNDHEPENNSMDTLTYNVSQDINLTSVINTTGDPDDYYKVQIPTGNFNFYLSLDWEGSTGTDMNLYLYNSAKALLQSSSGSSKPEKISAGWVTGGTFYIRAKAAAGKGIYQLHIRISEPFSLPPWVSSSIPIDSTPKTWDLAPW